MTIRPMLDEDIPAVIRVWQETVLRTKDADPPDLIHRLLARNPGLCHVAEERGTLIGVMVCGHDGRRGYLHHIGVVPSFRRRGVGRKLVEATLAALSQVGMTRVHLQLKQSNSVGLRFWKGLGCKDRSDLVVVSMRLSGAADGGGEG
jgi:N-acetylglutamate synthase